jgi:hypothetical protein
MFPRCDAMPAGSNEGLCIAVKTALSLHCLKFKKLLGDIFSTGKILGGLGKIPWVIFSYVVFPYGTSFGDASD